MLHLELDQWLYDIETGEDFSAKTRRLAMILSELRDKYYAAYQKNYTPQKGKCPSSKFCRKRGISEQSRRYEQHQNKSKKDTSNIERMKDKLNKIKD